jgi:hypothetical protein
MARIVLKLISIVSLSLGLWLGFDGKSFDLSTPSASAEAAATPATPKYKSIEIRDIQPAGYKVLADNPQTPGQAAGDFGEFDPKTWQVHRFLMTKPNGGWVKIGLARPVEWIESVERNDSGQVWLEFEELGIADWATLQATEPCPAYILGEGRLVTGTFEHSSGEVLNLFIAGEATPIGSTANHPFWSEDRQDFVQAGSLNPGEHLRLADGRTTTLERTEPIAEQLPVYNLEVDGEHVYFVGESGVLVHNAGDAYPIPQNTRGPIGRELIEEPGVSKFLDDLPKKQRATVDDLLDDLAHDRPGRNQHALRGDRAGQWAADLPGGGAGRGGRRLIFRYLEDGSILLEEIITGHRY